MKAPAESNADSNVKSEGEIALCKTDGWLDCILVTEKTASSNDQEVPEPSLQPEAPIGKVIGTLSPIETPSANRSKAKKGFVAPVVKASPTASQAVEEKEISSHPEPPPPPVLEAILDQKEDPFWADHSQEMELDLEVDVSSHEVPALGGYDCDLFEE
jgi:hypothetical protein